MQQQTVARARELLSADLWVHRAEGMEILAELDESELLLEYALQETEPTVANRAAIALFPAPLKLVLRMLRGANRGESLRFVLAKSNYLHAGDAIAALFASHRDMLHPDVIEAAGLAYLTPMASYLPGYLRTPLVSYADAFRDHGKQAVAGLRILVSSDGKDEWSRASLCAVEAAVALRRLGAEVDPTEIGRMLHELDAAIDPARYCSRRTRAMLRWIAFDSGWEQDPRRLLQLGGDRPPACLPDLLTTLLKRGEYGMCERLARDAPDVYRWGGGEFCYWPLVNFLEARGLLDVAPFSGHPTSPLKSYAWARRWKVNPPPWWRWQ